MSILDSEITDAQSGNVEARDPYCVVPAFYTHLCRGCIITVFYKNY